METLRLILLFLHILGFAALFGGLLTQLREPVKKVNALMRDGVGTAVVAGVALVGVLEALATPDDPVNHAKVGVKLLIGLVLLVLIMANTRKKSIPAGLFYGLLALTVVNIGVAVFWESAHV